MVSGSWGLSGSLGFCEIEHCVLHNFSSATTRPLGASQQPSTAACFAGHVP